MGAPEQVRPDGVHHYDSLDEVPRELRKYWLHRDNIFSKYDDDIWMTDDAWFAVTPEPIANKIAEHVATRAPPSKKILIDAFGGVGGNAIAFARSGRWGQIFAVENDPATRACGEHNSAVYGVAKKIFWVGEDVFESFKGRFRNAAKNAVVFASPPWGGPTYNNTEIFDLDAMQPYSLDHLHSTFSRLTPDFVLYLPRNSDLQQVAKLAKEGETLDVTHYCIAGASKALCVYFGK